VDGESEIFPFVIILTVTLVLHVVCISNRILKYDIDVEDCDVLYFKLTGIYRIDILIRYKIANLTICKTQS
jgi:hypothetical protein